MSGSSSFGPKQTKIASARTTVTDFNRKRIASSGSSSKGLPKPRLKVLTNKRRLIKDPVWGNLELFNWESELLNHFLFNRLHNVVQNSSAYKVYPGLKYSRFLHSVGVSHVVCQLFQNMASKAEGEAEVALRKEAKVINGYVDAKPRREIAQSIARSFPCSPDYAVMLAAIRVTALVHDIGHLPFSHVFENAIDGFRHGALRDAFNVTAHAEARRKKLNQVLEIRETSSESDAKLHEILGHIILDILYDELDYQKADILAGLVKAARDILTTDKYPIAKGLISSTIDADRIDFVRRDGFFSGLFNSSVDYGRMFAFYELAQDSETGKWLPRPSLRTLSETEKLLLERFLDYKYIVVHHTVHLFDELMENVLVRLMSNDALGDFLDRLCELLEFPNHGHKTIQNRLRQIGRLRSLLTEFDDPWLEMKIREQYAQPERNHDDVSRFLFEAYVEDRHCFRTAFKTDQEFHQLCSQVPALKSLDPVAIRSLFGASKYRLQKQLGKELGRFVLIGPTDKKLSFGIRDENAAHFLDVSDLHEYLVKKKINSLTFNFWYEILDTDSKDGNAEHEQVVKTALEFLRRETVQQMELIDSEAVA